MSGHLLIFQRIRLEECSKDLPDDCDKCDPAINLRSLWTPPGGCNKYIGTYVSSVQTHIHNYLSSPATEPLRRIRSVWMCDHLKPVVKQSASFVQDTTYFISKLAEALLLLRPYQYPRRYNTLY